MKPLHLELQSADGSQINLEALYQICPSCFTEVMGDDGKTLKRVVNFDVLRELLGDRAVDDADEFYQFTWPGKAEARREAARRINKTLRPMPEDSVNWDTTQNIYIEGDNLEALKLLQKSYLGKVKMIYIDPPYNTGNDFVYNDSFDVTNREQDLAEGNIDELGNRYRRNLDSNGKFHSDWCSMIYPRLQLARTLLTEDGVIFISIDDNEVRNLKNICDEVFGEKNFVAIINWKGRGGRQDSKYYAALHEYILVYAKTIDSFVAGEEIKQGDVFPKYDEQCGRYYKTQLLRKWGSNSLRTDRPNLYYPITAPDGTEVFPIIYSYTDASKSALQSSIEGRWRWGASTLAKAQQEGRIEFIKDKAGNWIPYEKIYAPKDGEEATKKYTTWIDESNNGATIIKDILGKGVFDYPKSPSLIQRFLLMANVEEDDIILDFFSGSATTAHAVMQLNAEDNGNRRFIMVQLPEETEEGSEARKAGYKNICEIGEERIRRAGKKIKEDAPLTTQDLDTGFRVFRIDDSNMQDVYFQPKAYDQEKLDLFFDNVKSDRTDLDLLFGAMLDWGVQLSLPMAKETVDDCDIYTVNEGDLVACFAPNITDGVIRAIADRSPLRVLFRDSCFAADNDKINIFEQFKQLLGWSNEDAMNNIRVI